MIATHHSFQSLADTLPEPLVLMSADGVVHAVNRACAAEFGWEPAGVTGVPFTRLVADAARATLGEYLQQCAHSDTMVPGKITLLSERSEPIPCRAEGRRFDADERAAILLRLSRLTDDHSNPDLERWQHQLTLLADAPTTLLSSLALEDVLKAIGRLGMQVLPAGAHAIWRFDQPLRTWRIAWHHGLSPAFVSEITSYEGMAPRSVPFTSPLPVTDVNHMALLAERRAVYAAEGVRSLLAIPLAIAGQQHGTFVAYFHERTAFSEPDLRAAAAFGSLSSSALTTAELYRLEGESRATAQLAERRAHFLSRASAALGSSLDYAQTLRTVAELAVPEIADWCSVDVIEGDALKRVAVAHADPERIRLADELIEKYPEDPSSPYSVNTVIRTGAPVLMPRLPDALLEAGARSPEHLALIRALGLVGFMRVPLLAHGQVLGVLTFVSAESRTEYSDTDLEFAQSVAARAALAVENAQAFAEAQRANRLKDEFLATLSHELRTPLNAILGYSRLLQSGALPDNRRDHAIRAVERNATALTQIVEDVLDVSRIVAGKIRLNVQPVDLPAVLRDAMATIAPAADAKGVRLQAIVDALAPSVSGDPDRLRQVVWNLLSNAVKFTPRGGRVQLRLERVNSHVHIVVSDTGAGIGPDFLPHVFERFRQADSRFTRQYAGLGLGLAIARQLVELHGGVISAASDGEGLGATFRISLPVPVVHQDAAREPVRVHPSAIALGPPDISVRLDGIRVLVVDDEPDALALVEEVLGMAGARVRTARSGPLALAALAEDVPDVLVTDLGMPGMDGFGLIAELRGSIDPRLRTLPAAALTAYARSEDRIRALRHGFQMHLSKPINPPELVAAVRALKPSG